MSDVVALVQVDEFQIIEGETYSSDDARVARNPQWFSALDGTPVAEEVPAPEQVEIERTEEPEAEPEPEG